MRASELSTTLAVPQQLASSPVRLLNLVRSQNLYYNTPGGKLNRGISVVDTFALLNPSGKELTDDEYFRAAVLGWCVELVSPSIKLTSAELGLTVDTNS